MHPIENIMQTAMGEIKEMVDVNTIVGDPVISTDGATIIPITKVSFGFVAGGGEYGAAGGQNGTDSGSGQHPFAGGASSGVSICPVGFLVVDENNIQLLPVSGRTVVEHLIESIPEFIVEIKEAFKRCREKGVE